MNKGLVKYMIVSGLLMFIISSVAFNVMLWNMTLQGECWLIVMLLYQLIQGIGTAMAFKVLMMVVDDD